MVQNKVRRYRKRTGLTQTQFAPLLQQKGIECNGQSTASKIEQHNNLPIATCYAVVAVLNDLGERCDLTDVFPPEASNDE